MKKKSLIMLVCALLIISSVAFGTIAYLTAHDGVTNRFTIGNVDITVDETLVDENGEPVPNPTDDPNDPDDSYQRTGDGNTYPLIPGSEYIKDPTLTVSANSEESYVRMVVTITHAKELKEIFTQLAAQYPDDYDGNFLPQEYVTGWDSETWPCFSMTELEGQNVFRLEFRYPDPVDPEGEAVPLPPLFKTIKIPGELSNAHLSMLEGFFIDVDGNAIQTAGFEDSADDAWTAFDAQMVAVSATPAP